MDLQTFVRESLMQIMNGIREAQTQQGKHGVLINPKRSTGWKINEVEFDIALTTAKKTQGGIKVMAVVVGGEGERVTEQSFVSRVKFTVLVVFPGPELKE